MNINFFKDGKSSVTINNVTYSGRNISIDNDKVVIDGVTQTTSLVGPITVTVNGSCESVSTISGAINISGNAGSVHATSGDVSVQGSVEGAIKTISGDVKVVRPHTNNINTISGDIKVTKG